jgi:hypothetical protein
MPILDDSPLTEKVRYANAVLKSRPRDLEDTLAQLVHEDDPVVAAAAIHFVGQRQRRGLSDDLEYVASHRSDNRIVGEAVSWALATRHAKVESLTASIDSLPIVELADRVRVIPLFATLSVDELFRIAEAGEEIRHPAGRELCHAATPAEEVLFLLEGGARTDRRSFSRRRRHAAGRDRFRGRAARHGASEHGARDRADRLLPYRR